MMLEVLLRARKHLCGRCARSAHDLAREVPSSQPDKQRVETVLDGLLVHRHAATFALASLLAVLQLQFGFRDAPLDLRLPESALRQFFFGGRTLLRFSRVRFVCVHRRRKYRSARAPSGVQCANSVRRHSVATPTCGDPPRPKRRLPRRRFTNGWRNKRKKGEGKGRRRREEGSL